MPKFLNTILEFLFATVLILVALWFVITQPIWVTKDPHIGQKPLANPATLHSYVKMLSETLPPRDSSEALLNPTAKWIEQQFSQYGTPTRQSFQVNEETYHNIIISFGPKNSETIVVGAHYDTADGLPGADDNASGVAGLIELARLLSRIQPSKHIELVAFTLEEPIFFGSQNMGSYRHAHSLKQQDRKVLFMASLEMIGYFSDEPHSQHFPIPLIEYLYPHRGNFIGIVGNLSNMGTVRRVKRGFLENTHIPTYSINAPALVPGIDYSDHKNYWEMGYPAVMITDTAFNRNKAYHTERDTADRLDYEKMAWVIEGIYQVIRNYH